ncbi:hypothetical protein [Halobellus litoreus]|nr:hypothetical protein [Halobellus litoreus]
MSEPLICGHCDVPVLMQAHPDPSYDWHCECPECGEWDGDMMYEEGDQAAKRYFAELREKVAAYKRFYHDELTRSEALDIIGEDNWEEVSRVAATELITEFNQSDSNRLVSCSVCDSTHYWSEDECVDREVTSLWSEWYYSAGGRR